MLSDTETVSRPRAAFQHRDFRLFQFGRALSIVGTEMQSVAVGWQVFEITHRPIDLGYVGLAQFLPAVLLSIPAGHTADRFDRRGVLMTCYVSYALCSLLLFFLFLLSYLTCPILNSYLGTLLLAKKF